MNSEEAWEIQAREQALYGKKESGEDALFVPFYHANRVLNERLSVRHTAELPEKFRRANQVCLDLLPYCHFLPSSPAGGRNVGTPKPKPSTTRRFTPARPNRS